MDRRTYLASTGAVLGGGFAGCLGRSGSDGGGDEGADDAGVDDAGSAESQMGVLSTAVSDDPADIGDFEKLVVTIDEVWVHPAGSGEGESDDENDDGEQTEETEKADENEGDEKQEDDEKTDGDEKQEGDEKDDGDTEDGKDEGEESDGKTHDESAEPIRIDVDGARADLVQLQGDAQQVIDSTEIEVGTYGQIKLWVADEVDAVLTDGTEAEVMTPGDAPLKFNEAFEISENTETTFTADFAPHKRGPNGYVLKPVAEEVRVEYNELDGDGGEESDETDEESGESTDEGESAADDESGADNESGADGGSDA